MMATPSRNTRMPSSAVAVNVTLPPANEKRPVQRTEKLSTGSPAGPPAAQSLVITVSQAVRVAGGVRPMLLKYSAMNWPSGHPLPGLTVKVSGFDSASGLITWTVTEPGVAMSLAAMLAVSRVELTNVVGRGEPFQDTLEVETKLPPSAVSVKAGPPAVAVLGVMEARVGGVGATAFQLTWMTASPVLS